FVRLERARQAALVQALVDVVLRAQVAHLHAEHRRGKDPEPRAVRSADIRAAQRLVVLRGAALQDDAELALRHRSRGKHERCDADGNQKLLHVVSPHGNHGKSAACSARGDRHGKDAAEKRPAWPFVPGGAVGPVKLELQKDLARRLRAGHPWVYKRAIERPPSGLQAGSIVDIVAGGKFVARGYYDPWSAVRVRVLTRDPAEAIGPLFWRRRIARAVALRRTLTPFEGETDCARLVHGEGDGLPGVVVDLYAKWAVVKLYSAGLVAHRARRELLLVHGRLLGLGGAGRGPARGLGRSRRGSDPSGAAQFRAERIRSRKARVRRLRRARVSAGAEGAVRSHRARSARL